VPLLELPQNQEKRDEIKRYTKTKGIDEINEFSQILNDVFENINKDKNYRDSEFLQTIRLMKIYKINLRKN
jgi:hypothetical protein